MSLAYPYFVLLAPILLVLYRLRPQAHKALNFSDVRLIEDIRPSFRLRLRGPVLGLLRTTFIVCLSLAAARPQKIVNHIQPKKTHNVLLAVDLSRSMETPDFGSSFGMISRFDGVKKVIAEFIRDRVDDRIGLVVFGSNAFLQSPLTLDHELVAQMVENLVLGIAGDATAMGDGLGLSLKRLKEIDGDSKTVILLTDGVSNSGQVNPLKAAQVAADLKIKVHTIGIGSQAQIQRRVGAGIFAQNLNQTAEFDEKTLREIARLTGGVYFNAASTEGLTDVYNQIDKLEKTDQEDPSRQIVEEYFTDFIVAALVSYLLALMLARTYFLKLP